MRSLLNLSLFALSFFAGATFAEPHGQRRHHDSLARRARGDLQQRGFQDTRFTFYAVGLGACGQYNVPSDFIVALNTPQFGDGYPGPNCFKMITISFGGKTTQAQIMDECPGCPWGGLDMSTGLFQFFAAESVGVLYGSWYFNDAGGGGGDTTTTSKWTPPTTTSEWQPPSSTWSPSPTYEADTPSTSTTSTWSAPSKTSTSSSSHSTPPPANSLDLSSGAASGLAVPTGVVGDNNDPQVILSIYQAIVGIGGLIVAGHGV